MSGTSRVISAIAAVAVLLSLAACAGSTTAGQATFEVRPVAGQQEPPPVAAAGTIPVEETDAADIPSLNAADVEGVGRVLTDQDGMTLYRYDRDTTNPSASACVGVCLRAWPPLIVENLSEVVVSGMARNLVGTVPRPDGTLQVTVAGWPVYRFARDSEPGVAGGQEAGGVWFAITPDGGRAASTATAPDQDGRAAGAPVPAITARDLPGFGPALTDREGFTLYLFTGDDKASGSTCVGECARRWPPVLSGGAEPELSGVDPAIVGEVARADGTRQVTVGGWPVHRFADDAAPGRTGGHGVDGAWFVIDPAGRKSRVPVQEQAPEAAAEPESGGGY